MASIRETTDLEFGDSEELYNIGIFYSNGNETEKDLILALKYFQHAAKKGHREARLELVNLYFDQKETLQFPISEEYLILAAKKGHAEASHRVGMTCYENSSFEEAAAYFYLSTVEGFREGQFMLGVLHYHGHGVKQDFRLAAEYFQLAADQGHMHAQFNLANLIMKGKWIKKDIGLAMKYFEDAAQQGHTDAEAIFGQCCFRGLEIKKDTEKGLKYLKSAADKNNADAQYALGVIFVERKQYIDAIKYFPFLIWDTI